MEIWPCQTPTVGKPFPISGLRVTVLTGAAGDYWRTNLVSKFIILWPPAPMTLAKSAYCNWLIWKPEYHGDSLYYVEHRHPEVALNVLRSHVVSHVSASSVLATTCLAEIWNIVWFQNSPTARSVYAQLSSPIDFRTCVSSQLHIKPQDRAKKLEYGKLCEK